MQPAFSSRRQLGAFALLLGTLLVLPSVVGLTGALKRTDVYPTVAVKYGPFSWIQQQIFEERAPIDLAFMGSSHIWCAIDTPFVAQALGKHLARDARVITLSWPWPGFDAVYVAARDLLAHRRVTTLVIDDEGPSDQPHIHSTRWFLAGDDPSMLAGLSLASQAGLYGGAVLGMPRHLVSLLRTDRLEDPLEPRPTFWTDFYRAPNIASRLGALRARLSYGHAHGFTPFSPHRIATAADARIESESTRADFAIVGPTTPPYSLHFLRLLAELCRAHGTRLVLLHTPSFDERAEPRVREREHWAERLGTPVDVLGVPPSRLFSGLTDAEVERLFYDNDHLNENGQDYFTPVVTPALIELHANSSRQD